MPAPGDQHLSSGGRIITNPFEEVKPRMSEYTAQEIATLQCRLEKQLGPEYISSRAGPLGQKVHYLAAEKCIQLANEVFGFNGWSSQIMDVTVDFFDENPTTFKISLGISVIVRVTLRDGTFHEDIGYGHIENCKGKAAAFEKAKKEGTTDALKRALRSFGNVLGNCIYDKDYLSKVTKIKAQPAARWDVENLHRHSTYAQPPKKVLAPEIKYTEEKSQSGAANASNTSEETFDDEFGDFDEVDFNIADSDSHPDEVALPAPPGVPKQFNGSRGGNSSTIGTTPNQARLAINQQPPMATPGRLTITGQPQHQNPSTGFARSDSGAGQGMPPPQDSAPLSRPAQLPQAISMAGRVLNQPSRNGPPSAPASPARLINSMDEIDAIAMPPQGQGFFSARAATLLPEGPATEGPPPPIPSHLPIFNPHAESPSIRKTPGIDHRFSKALTKDLKHLPASTQATASAAINQRPNIVNPQLDSARRIGVPGSPSPMGTRGHYKPLSIKRSLDTNGDVQSTTRAPLVDLPANGAIGADAGGDAKRKRLNS